MTVYTLLVWYEKDYVFQGVYLSEEDAKQQLQYYERCGKVRILRTQVGEAPHFPESYTKESSFYEFRDGVWVCIKQMKEPIE